MWSRSRIVRAASAGALLPLCLTACTRFGYGPSPGDANASAPIDGGTVTVSDRGTVTVSDRGTVTVSDRGPEAAVDTGSPLDASATLPQLSCANPPILIASGPSLLEPALQSDGLRLWARIPDTTPYYTERAAVNASFGGWTARGDLAGKEDPTFFTFQGTDLMMQAIRIAGNRDLELCTVVDFPTRTCSPVVLVDTATQTIDSLDTDGPSLIVLGGVAQMLINVTSSIGETDIYQAVPTSADLLAWTVSPIPSLAQPGIQEDDPALSPDGTITVFSVDGGATKSDLWVSHKTKSGWSTPAALSALNTSEAESGPSFGVTSGATLELFFHSSRSGKDQIYQAQCQLSP